MPGDGGTVVDVVPGSPGSSMKAASPGKLRDEVIVEGKVCGRRLENSEGLNYLLGNVGETPE